MQCSPICHKDLHYHPYKIQVAQELSEWDKVILLQFCNEFLDLVKNKSNIVNTLLMSSDAHFRVSGYVNKHNCHYWAPNNPHELHHCLLHSAKVQCVVKFVLMASLVLISLRMQRVIQYL